MHFRMYCKQAFQMYIRMIHPKYGSSHAKDKRIKEEIEPIYKTDKQGTHVTYTCKPIKRADTRNARDRACKIEPCQKDQG